VNSIAYGGPRTKYPTLVQYKQPSTSQSLVDSSHYCDLLPLTCKTGHRNSDEISSSSLETPLDTTQWQLKIKSTLNITISTTTLAKLKTFFYFKIATHGGFLSISPATGMCHKIQTTYAHDNTRLDIVHVACLTSIETGICPTGGVWTSKPEYVFIGGRYPQCVRAAKRGERRRGTKQCKVQ